MFMSRIRSQLRNSQKSFNFMGFCGGFTLILIPIFIIASIYTMFQFGNYNDFANAKTLNTDTAQFEVKEGETLDEIMTNLIQSGVLNERQVFIFPASELYLRFNSIDTKNIQAGIHEIPANTPVLEVFNYLKLQECEQFTVTLKEGLRIEEYAEKISQSIYSKGNQEKVRFSADEFVSIAKNYTPGNNLNLGFTPPSNLEGYLFPDTYNFCMSVSSRQVIDKLLQTFDTKVFQVIKSNLAAKNLSLQDTVNMASMVERESFNNDERRVIAGILNNRLSIGEVLGVDATSQYSNGYSQKQKTWWVKGDELAIAVQREDSYNTRKNAGLPPTPIANPGLDSIQAVINPTKTDYYYYVHNDCGGIHYAKTLSEHNLNAARYVGTGRC